ncbi:hypothetical protein [uncultured Thiodictyon sp.]|uniref:hypothetical protein n=1 Tax=uncultured Thiodictyon sp. TaxID=1846217 RepID=UPI0025F1EC41|nr:hypothetical protein [uncultured Thiodictyon sp.]
MLAGYDPKLAERFTNLSADTAGHCCVLLTGSPEPLSARLATALWRGAKEFWRDHQGRRPAILNTLEDLAQQGRLRPSDIKPVIGQLQAAIAQAQGNGLLLIIDELGKFLEYEARHGANDIYLLQALAEHALRHQGAPLNLVVLLHQSFEQYAQHLGEALRNEWTKVQGRFENIPFLDPPDQTLRIVAAACRQRLNADEQALVRRECRDAAAVLQTEGALPTALGVTEATDLFAACYPLHPIAALLLPPLCQRVAQNERTLFSYLGSQEPHGFRDSLARLDRVGDSIEPAEIYDYFILNQPAASTSHHTHRRWNEVVTAVERLGDAPPTQIALLKAIGLLNIIGAQGNLKASPPIIALCAGDDPQPLIDDLLARSLIQFRRFSNEYRVWAGSDFDLEAEFTRARRELADMDRVAALAQRPAPRPLVARRHSIATGTLRWFQPVYTDLARCLTLDANPTVPRLLQLLLDEDDDQAELARTLSALPPSDFAVVCTDSASLGEALIEVMAGEAIRRQTQGLQGDPVAERELRERQATADQSLERELTRVFARPGEARWYWQGRELPIAGKADLQRALSEILDSRYRHTPRLRNEMINRDQPSGQAAGGRNRLLAAMFEHPATEDLGIDKFPPEKAMYRALLRAPGLHRQEDGLWGFHRPPTSDPYGFRPLFDFFDAQLVAHEGAPLPLPHLFAVLSAQPYGIKAGTAPIMLMAYYLAHQREIAMYEDAVFCPTFGGEQLELLAKRPERFAIERFRLQGGRLILFRKYLETIVGRIPDPATLLDIIRPLAKFIRTLPSYAQKASHLSDTAVAIRENFPRAHGPAALLFETLPRACGFAPIAITDADESKMDEYLRTLVGGLRELRDVYPGMVEDFQQKLARAFGLDAGLSLAQLREALTARFRDLDRYAGEDRQDLRAFIRRLTAGHNDHQPWLESVMTLLGKTPPQKWSDDQCLHAIECLSDLAVRLRDLETLDHAVQARPVGQDREIVLLRSVSSADGERPGRIAYISPDQRPLIDAHAERINVLLENLENQELRLAIIARLLQVEN